jgi:hypothetical protein
MNRNNINDITAYRKRKKHEKILLSIIIFSFAAILVIVIAANIQNIVAPLEGIGQRIQRGRTVTEGGFPVRLPGSANSIEVFADGFMLISPTYVYTYTSDGGQISSRRHGYSAPQSAVGGNRILIYDQNGRRFSVFNNGGMVFEKETDERIAHAALGNTGSAALIYRGDSHISILSVYDNRGEWKFTKRFSSENAMQAAFVQNDNDVIVTSIGYNAGGLYATVGRFNTSSTDEEGVWQTDLIGSFSDAGNAENLLPLALEVRGNSVFVLCNSALFVLDVASGEITGSHSFRGTLVDYSFADDTAVLLVNDYTAGRVNLIALDHRVTGNSGSLAFRETREISAGTSQAELYGTTLTLLETGAIVQFENFTDGGSTENIAETHPLGENFTRFVQSNGKILLLGYNTVEQLHPNADTEVTSEDE